MLCVLNGDFEVTGYMHKARRDGGGAQQQIFGLQPLTDYSANVYKVLSEHALR